MSPAGIPMFYGSSDPETVTAEMGHSKFPVATVAEFETLRDLRLMDLNEIPPVPSLFDDELAPDRPAFLFLRNLAVRSASRYQEMVESTSTTCLLRS